jgi:hypothetical protein
MGRHLIDDEYPAHNAPSSGQLPVIIAVVVTVAFLLIMTAFRSLPLAIKAAALNLFSIDVEGAPEPPAASTAASTEIPAPAGQA